MAPPPLRPSPRPLRHLPLLRPRDPSPDPPSSPLSPPLSPRQASLEGSAAPGAAGWSGEGAVDAAALAALMVDDGAGDVPPPEGEAEEEDFESEMPPVEPMKLLELLTAAGLKPGPGGVTLEGFTRGEEATLEVTSPRMGGACGGDDGGAEPMSLHPCDSFSLPHPPHPHPLSLSPCCR